MVRKRSALQYIKIANNSTPHFSFLTPIHVDFISKNQYIVDRGNEMAVKVKPVQPTEIKDKKIILEVIEQIRKPIPDSVYREHEKIAEYLDKFMRRDNAPRV